MKRLSTSVLVLFAGSSLFAQVIFTSSGPFTVPAGVDTITVELIGAGGNGASNGGGGGGGGGYAKGTYAVSAGSSYSIVVGAGGSELATIAGGLGLLAEAGSNANTVSNPNIGGGGAGGAGLGGQVSRTGGNGGGGYYTYFGGGGGGAAGSSANGGPGGNTIVWNGSNCMTPGGVAGVGGGAPAGNGGKGAGFTDNNCTVTNPAGNGVAYGGGGGGGNGIGSPVGIGGGGYCRISWNLSTAVERNAASVMPRLLQDPFMDRIVLRDVVGTERYQLLDAGGRLIWAGTHIEEQDFSHLYPGMYVLRVAVDGTVWATKAVKQASVR